MRQRNRHNHLAMCVIVLGFFIMVGSLQATLMSALSLDELVERSTLIVEGQVSRIRSGVPVDQPNTIVSYIDVTLAPDGVLKDDAQANATARREANTITLKLLGGTANIMTHEGKVEKRTLVVVGNPGFKVDEEVVLFARPGKGEMFGGFFRLVGMAQGKYRVEGGIATRRTDQIGWVGQGPEERLEELPVEELKGMVRDEVQRQEAAKQQGQ